MLILQSMTAAQTSLLYPDTVLNFTSRSGNASVKTAFSNIGFPITVEILYIELLFEPRSACLEANTT
jgi:hypothetical protein